MNTATKGLRVTSRLEQRAASSNDAGARAGRAAAHSADIEVHLAELRQMFDEMDPSPFHDRDLDPRAAEYIVGWARELPSRPSVSLLVQLERSAGIADEETLLGEAVRPFFGGRSTAARQRLKQLFRSGRISLLIGLAFLVAAFAASQLIGRWVLANPVGDLLRESVLIGGWVAMWRPIEIFLYDWWPIRAEARLYDRLAAMPVRIHYLSTQASDAWKSDWPAAFAGDAYSMAAGRGADTAQAGIPRAKRNP
jgi:hypothetical protein